jgi:hypothetical protein
MTRKAIEETRPAERAGVPRGTVHRALAVFFVAGALLNGENLLRSAERMEHGRPMRSVWIAAARPVAAVSRSLGLGAPRRWIETRIASLDKRR